MQDIHNISKYGENDWVKQKYEGIIIQMLPQLETYSLGMTNIIQLKWITMKIYLNITILQIVILVMTC